MLKRFFIFAMISTLVTSCYKYRAPEKPDNLISKDKMVDILIDLRLMGSANGNNRRILEDSIAKPHAYIYQKYNVDSTQFAKSNEYYAYYLSEYEEIYKVIKDSLNELKTHYKKLVDKAAREKKLQDSLEALEKTIKKDTLLFDMHKLKAGENLGIDELIELDEGLIESISDEIEQQSP